MTAKDKTVTGAFGKDKLYGNRLDESFELGERFVMLAARISDDVIETELGPANPARLLVQRTNDNDEAIGAPFVTTTLASAIREKVEALQDGELPALVELRKVESKYGTEALVIQYVGGSDPEAIADEFGMSADELHTRGEAMRGANDRIPL